MQSQRTAIDVVGRSRPRFKHFVGRFALLLGLLPGALPARGVDVEFTERVISWAADGGTSVFATDVDGDGNTDILSASVYDDKIAWYENDSGSAVAPHVVEFRRDDTSGRIMVPRLTGLVHDHRNPYPAARAAGYMGAPLRS